MTIDSVSTIRFMVLISVVLSFLVGRGSLLIQCQEFEILFIPFISASILIYVRVYINYVQSYAIIRKIYPFCPVFFHLYSIFRQKPRPSSRFLPFQAVSFETICTSSACAKVAQPLSRRPATLAQICRRHLPSSPLHPPSTLPIVFHFFAASSVLTAISSILPQSPFIFSAAPAVLPAILPLLSATAPILPATNYMLISGHEIMIAKHDFIISCPETTVSRLAIILKRAAGAMALMSAQVLAYASDIVITINRI